jgi:hypothetical protein
MRILSVAVAFVVLASGATLLAGQPPAAKQEAPYPGLLAEMRSADLVVLVKGAESVASKEWDAERKSPKTWHVAGAIEAVYKGAAEKGQAIEITIPYAEQAQRVYNGELYSTFFATAPYPGDQPLVYLLKGKENRVVNIVMPQPVIAEYVRIAALKTDAEAAVELIRLHHHLVKDERTTNAWPAPYVTADDVRRCYPSLDLKGEAFAKLLAEFRPQIFQAAVDSGEPFLQAMWLGSFLPEADRKKLVAPLVDQYEANAKVIAALEKQPEPPARLPRDLDENAAGAGAGRRAPTPLELAQARAAALVTGMTLLTDTSWHDRISKTTAAGLIFPLDLFPNTPDAEKEEVTVAKAKAFIK